MKQAPVLTERDMKRVLQHVARTAYPARNRCLLMLSWLAGMRVGEIAALSFEDVRAPGGERRPEIQLRPDQTGGSSARTLLVGSKQRSELDACVPSRPTQSLREISLNAKTGRGDAGSGLQIYSNMLENDLNDRKRQLVMTRGFQRDIAHAIQAIPELF